MNVALPPSRVLELFSGYGGLGLGLELATGCRTVCHVEREAFAAAVLVARMEEQALGVAPCWDDVGTFDGKPWRGVVDCVAGGSPCQDLSVAGKRAGLDGARSGLWREMLRIVDEAGPAFVFWENVGGAIATALDVVTADLEGLGYRAAACTVAASDVGAPHERLRLFVLAYSERNALRKQPEPESGRGGAAVVGFAGGEVADAEHARQRERGTTHDKHRSDAPRHDADGRNAEVGNTGGARQQGSEQRGDAAVAQSDSEGRSGAGWGRPGDALGAGPFRWPPGPGSPEWERVPTCSQPALRRVVDGPACQLDAAAFRNDRLRLLGNGVVPQQAAVAFMVCWHRLFGAEG